MAQPMTRTLRWANGLLVISNAEAHFGWALEELFADLIPNLLLLRSPLNNNICYTKVITYEIIHIIYESL